MSRKMLINVMHPEEARVAIVEDGHLVELDIEIAGNEQTRGNVYKGVVVRVEPGLQAAFVDIGLKKLGFLQMGEIHPSNWQWRDDVPEENRNRRPRIQEILRRGQELIVQVEKGERDMKGAALTTYLSLPGRYMVLMPGSDSAGISRKVESDSERKKLKELVADLEIPEGVGYIVRTEALGKKDTELAKDLDYLLKLSESITEKGAAAKAPALIYQESGLINRTIRDYFTSDIDEVLVDSKEGYRQAKAFFKETMPKFEKLVKQHTEKRPIFSRYQIEEQIDLIYEKKVPLKSGGSIVIEPTEALVSIDVNSGKSTGERGVEDTAFKTNLEAAEEVARQLRLRDLGGLIVIDFIDMRERKHNAEVEKTLKTALKADKARVNVGKISQFGILEMSRQRIKQTLDQASVSECPHCGGRGKVKSVENMALSFLRKVHASAAKGTAAEVRGGLPLEVAYYLLNRKKRELAQIENDYDIEVTVKGKPSFLMNQLELELIRREKGAMVEPAEERESAAAEPARGAAPAPATSDEEAKGKKKRRRGKKKPKSDAELSLEAAETSLEEPAEVPVASTEETAAEDHEIEELSGEAPGDEAVPTDEAKKKRRRRKRRSGKRPADEISAEGSEQPETTEGEELPAAAEGEEAAEDETAAEGETPADEAKKKRRRRKRRTSKRPAEGETAEGAEQSEAVKVDASAISAPEAAPAEQKSAVSEQSAEAAPQTDEAPAKPKKPRPSRAKKKTEPAAEATAPATETASEAPASAPAEPVATPASSAPEKKAAPRKPRARKTAAAEVDMAPEVQAPPPTEAPAEEKPKKKRAPRAKKSVTPDPEEA